MSRKLVLASLLLLTACSGTTPDYGSHGDFVAPDCPPSPNCVSSAAIDPQKRIPVLRPAPAPAELARLIATLPRSRIVYQGTDYTHAEVSSRVWRFVDDLLFWPTGDGALHLRSASRVGYSDFGVNRERAEHLLQAWQEMQQGSR